MSNQEREVLVVASKVKEYIKTKGMMSAGELPEALSEVLYAELDRACQRAKENGRQTVQARDV